MKKSSNYIKLEFLSRSTNEGFARSAVAAFASQLDPTLDELGDIKTAVSEAVTNAIVHAYPQEIGKIAAYAKGKTVTEKDIDAVADPQLSAEVFKLSDAVLKGDYDLAAKILGDLLKLQTEPILINAALGSQLRRIYTARIALDTGRDRAWLMELWGMKSDYPAKLLLSAARRTTAQ